MIALRNGAEMPGYPVPSGRKIYLHVARGALSANRQSLNPGYALMYSDDASVELAAGIDAEVLLFEMA